MSDEVCSGSTSIARSARASAWSYLVRLVDVVRCVLIVWVLRLLLYLLGTVGGSGMSLGKNAVICGKLEPDGVRNDCDLIDVAFASLPASASELSVFDSDRTSSELLNCDCRGCPFRPRLSNELKVDAELLICSGGLRSPARALPSREPFGLLERTLGARDCFFATRAFCFCSLSRSFSAAGTPSHFALTFRTCSGSLAEDTPGIALALSSPCWASKCAASLSKATPVGSFVTNRPPKRLFFFCVVGETGGLETFGNCSLLLELDSLKTFSELAEVWVLGGVFDRTLAVLLGNSAIISSFSAANFWADSWERSVDSEFRYESLGIWAGLYSGRVGEVGMVACIATDTLMLMLNWKD
jgi:hypothetical protein